MKKDKKIIIGLLILLIIAVAAAVFLFLREEKTAIIVKTDEQLQDVDGTNQLRMTLNTSIEVKEDTMQNIYFQNLNKDRYLKCQIKLDGEDEYIYESQMIGENETIRADVIDASKLKKGENHALALISAYDMNKKRTKTTGAKIVLIK